MGVPENIDALLMANDITQESFACIAGVSPVAVSGWRRGSTPQPDAVQRICDFFRLNQDGVFSEMYRLASKEHGSKYTLRKNGMQMGYVPL